MNTTFFDDLYTQILAKIPLYSSHNRVVFEIENINLLHLFSIVDSYPKFFWKSKHSDDLCISFGLAHSSVFTKKDTNYDYTQDFIKKNARVYILNSFNLKDSIKFHRKKIKSQTMIVPAFDFYTENGKKFCAVNYMNKKQFYQNFHIFKSKCIKPVRPASNKIIKERYYPNYDIWVKIIKKVQTIFATSDVVKIVLARIWFLKFENNIHATNLFLEMIQDNKNLYSFYCQLSSNVVFMSFSPETLFLRTYRNIFCEAIAGTRPRGQSIIDDNLLYEDLNSARKDKEEHNIVERSIFNLLETIATNVIISSREVLKLNYIQHIYSFFKATLNDDIDDLTLLETLHPTPAVGGYPMDIAKKWIKKLEVFDRGLYAAPIGYITKDKSEFAVAIRSALIDHKKIYVYSGAGIISSSDSQIEWKELNNKISIFRDVLIK